MKKLVFIAALLCGLNAAAQQVPIYNHYYINPYVYNPAAAGASGYGKINLSNRMQWMGSQNQLSASILTAELPLQKNITLAARFYNDKQALLTTNSAVMTFAYRLKLTEEQRLSFGLSAGFHGKSINQGDLNVTDPDDLAIQNYNSKGLDGNAGVYYQYKQLTLGAALPTLFGNTNYIGQKEGNINNFLLSAGYKINSDFISVEPQLIFRSGKEVLGTVESMVTLYFKDAFWVGGLYRTQYGPAFYGGIKINSAFKAGYTYETAPASTNGAINGTHELLISYQFGSKKPY